MARYRGLQSKEQRRAYFAKMKGRSPVRHYGWNRPLDLTASLLTHNLPGRAVRRFVTEPQYSAAERQIRRGHMEHRIGDWAKQALLPSVAGTVTHGAVTLASRNPVLGMGAGVLATGGTFAASRIHVNRLRNERLVKRGGKVRSWTGKVR